MSFDTAAQPFGPARGIFGFMPGVLPLSTLMPTASQPAPASASQAHSRSHSQTTPSQSTSSSSSLLWSPFGLRLPAFLSASAAAPVPGASPAEPSSSSNDHQDSGGSSGSGKSSNPKSNGVDSTSLLPPLSEMVPVMLASSVSGMISRIPCHPLDTIKAKLQAISSAPVAAAASTPGHPAAFHAPGHPGSIPAFNPYNTATTSAATTAPAPAPAVHRPTITSLFTHTLRTEGPRGLYAGFWVVFLGSAPGGFAYFTSYELAKSVLGRVRDATGPDPRALTHGHSDDNDSVAGAVQQQQQPASAQGRGLVTRAAHTVLAAPFALNFTAGLLAEAVSCVVWLPIDVVKERLQVQSLAPPAVTAAAAAAAPATASASGTAVVTGSATGSAAPQPLQYRGTWDALRRIAREDGLRGLYRGYGATLASFGPFSALYLSSYEWFKATAAEMYRANAAATSANGASTRAGDDAAEAPLPAWLFLCSGALAGGLASLVTNPLDLVKLRIQIQRNAAAQQRRLATATASSAAAVAAVVAEGAALPAAVGAGSIPPGFDFGYRSTLQGLGKLVRTEGVRGLFKGAGARVLFAAPASAISIALFDSLKQAFAGVGTRFAKQDATAH